MTAVPNRVHPRRKRDDEPTVRKVDATSVSYGESISKNGRIVWGAFDASNTLISIGATAGEARRKYRQVLRRKASPKS
jgi:hypothetical protein